MDLSNTGSWVEPLRSQEGLELGKGLDYVRQRLLENLPEKHIFQLQEKEGRVHAILRMSLSSKVKQQEEQQS